MYHFGCPRQFPHSMSNGRVILYYSLWSISCWGDAQAQVHKHKCYSSCKRVSLGHTYCCGRSTAFFTIVIAVGFSVEYSHNSIDKVTSTQKHRWYTFWNCIIIACHHLFCAIVVGSDLQHAANARGFTQPLYYTYIQIYDTMYFFFVRCWYHWVVRAFDCGPFTCQREISYSKNKVPPAKLWLVTDLV